VVERPVEERKYLHTTNPRIRLEGKDVRVNLRNRNFDDPVFTFWEFEAYFRNYGIRKSISFKA